MRTTGVIFVIAAVALYGLKLLFYPRPSTLARIPPVDAIEDYVESLEFWDERNHQGISLTLTSEGLDYGRRGSGGASMLARFVMEQPGWRGERTQENVKDEIIAHCVAWRWIVPLRSRANPVDIEFFAPWPLNVFTSFRRFRF